MGYENLETIIKYYIGAIKKSEARKFINDSHFNFMPELAIVQQKHKI